MKWFQRILYSFCIICRKRQSRTVRFAFPLVFVGVTLIGFAAVSTTETSSVRLKASQNVLDRKEVFAVDVYAKAHVPVNAVNIEVDYPEDKLDVFSIDTGESVITIWTEDPYDTGSTVLFSGGTFRRGFVGEHLIGTVNFLPRESGSFTFSVSDLQLLAGDGSGTEVSVKKTDEQVVVVDAINQDGVVTGLVTFDVATDIDGDGNVSLSDVSIFMSAWRKGTTVYDFNGDKRMTFVDFAIILSDSFFK